MFFKEYAMNEDDYEDDYDDDYDEPSESPQLERPDEPLDIFGEGMVGGQPLSDEQVRFGSVPNEPSGYTLPESVTGAEGYSATLFESFAAAAHAQKFTQGQLEGAIAWWNENAPDYAESGYDSDFTAEFMNFASENRLTESQVHVLQAWFETEKQKAITGIEQIQIDSARLYGKPRSVDSAAEILRVLNSSAYTNKGDTDAARSAHAGAVKLMLELTQKRGA